MKYFILILLTLFFLSNIAQAQSTPTVDLLWSAQTYAPLFYRGHTVATAQSQIKVVAVVTWSGSETKDLNFQWQRDGQVLSRSSGLGKDNITFTSGKTGETHQIEVQVIDKKGLRQSASTEIKIGQPTLVIYQNDPLIGINYGRAISGDLNLSQPEISLQAEPYFFSLREVSEQKLDYRWQLDNKRVVPNPVDNRLITFAAPSGTTGDNLIKLEVLNLNNVFQTAAKQFRINFGIDQDFTF